MLARLGNGLLGDSLKAYHTAVLLCIRTAMNLSKRGLKDSSPCIQTFGFHEKGVCEQWEGGEVTMIFFPLKRLM
jgi:hypothetical protein